jgi:hypothetical protein
MLSNVKHRYFTHKRSMHVTKTVREPLLHCSLNLFSPAFNSFCYIDLFRMVNQTVLSPCKPIPHLAFAKKRGFDLLFRPIKLPWFLLLKPLKSYRTTLIDLMPLKEQLTQTLTLFWVQHEYFTHYEVYM